MSDVYTVISSDAHAGLPTPQYREDAMHEVHRILARLGFADPYANSAGTAASSAATRPRSSSRSPSPRATRSPRAR